MPNLCLDLDAYATNVPCALTEKNYSAIFGQDMRSPRTPTYMPKSPQSLHVTPFDPVCIFPSAQPSTQEDSPTMLYRPPPNKPLTWVWQCHLCKSRYPLSVTRRCLHDGHFYCSGELDQRNINRKKRGQSCSSEFDYLGWKEWGEWKRGMTKDFAHGTTEQKCLQGCTNCDFPSQCRHMPNIPPLPSLVDYSKTVTTETLHRPSGPNGFDTFPVTGNEHLQHDAGANITFDSILASVVLKQGIEEVDLRSVQTVPDKGQNSGSCTADISAGKPGIATLNRVTKSAETRSRRKSNLPSIVEESLLFDHSGSIPICP